MTGPFSDYFSKRRTAATDAAAVMLREAGFTPSGERKWKGTTFKGHPIEVALPHGFPDELPEVFRVRAEDGHVAHVDRSGKVCIAPDSGTRLDCTRPADIVKDAIEKADNILEAKPEDQVKEILREYESYWAELTSHIVSICPPRSATGECWEVELEAEPPMTLVAPTFEAAWEWARATGRKVLKQSSAFFLRLPKPLKPPPFGNRISFRELLRAVEQSESPETAQRLERWVSSHGLPATIVISAPLDEREDIVAAVQIPELNLQAAARAQKGFRPGKVPPQIIVAQAASESVRRLDVARADLDFLLPRGGAVLALLSKTVAVLGCGSVGSFAAGALAATGIGRLVLVDPQVLKTENFQRHVLGASSLGEAKVTGLATSLRARFPHIKVTEINNDVQESLDRAESPVLAADLVLCALGEDNLELQLNELLWRRQRCIHVWLDPLGVGGHVLRAGAGGNPGCLQCLFRPDPTHGLVNMASLVEPSQRFQRSLAGCSGTFTPFGALDAERAGIEAAREVIACLTTDVACAQLSSWVTSKEAITSAGFALSRRGETLTEGSLIRDTTFPLSDCPICSRRSP